MIHQDPISKLFQTDLRVVKAVIEYLIDKIREMKEKGLTQRDVADRLSISESKVSRILKRAKN